MSKTLSLFIFLFLTSFYSFSINVIGDWYGSIEVPGNPVAVVLHIEKSGEGYIGTMDSPSQNAFGITLTSVSLADDIFKFSLNQAAISYEGLVTENDEIIGGFKQGGGEFQLNFYREKQEEKIVKRSQEPKGPFSYIEEEVEFINQSAEIKLSGTLTIPKVGSKFPVVILISGSGPQDRNEELLGHKPFLVLANHLTNLGIAVLRFDDRGVAESEGDFEAATSVDFASDVMAAVDYLKSRKEIDKKHIGLIGHSEGGVIAPIVAKEDKCIDFIVLLAGTGIRGAELLLMQQKLIQKSNGMSDEDLAELIKTNEDVFKIVLESQSAEEARLLLKEYLIPVIGKVPDEEIPE